MGHPATAIPEKIFFKIGEVCDLVGVQAHVLRYWETEFPMLSPQKNRSGQRSYRRRDVEIALRIKELLYDDLYTIAGAKKKLQVEMRETTRLKIVHSEPSQKESFIKEVKPTVAPGKDFAQFRDIEVARAFRAKLEKRQGCFHVFSWHQPKPAELTNIAEVGNRAVVEAERHMRSTVGIRIVRFGNRMTGTDLAAAGREDGDLAGELEMDEQ